MPRLYLLADVPEVLRRRRLVTGQVIETWPDLYTAGEVWVGEGAKQALDAVGVPLPARLSLDAAAVPIYYGPRLADVESLPLEESLLARVLSAHGLAVAWITFDQFGERTRYEPRGPADPVFYLRRPGGAAAHVWRLFRSRREAQVYLAEHYGRDSEGRDWAERLPVDTFAELLARRALPG
jgi:hypothetical protein